MSREEARQVQFGVDGVSRHGNVWLSCTAEEFVETGFEIGDVVSVIVGEASVDAPVCVNYSAVDAGEPVVVVDLADDNDVTLSINGGDFAEAVGLRAADAKDPAAHGGPAAGAGRSSEELQEKNAGRTAVDYVTIRMKQKDGFPGAAFSRSNSREDYPGLTDEEYANFREVRAGGIGRGVLWRSSSPIDPSLNRSREADEAARKAGIRTFLNLADTQEEAESFAWFGGTYYARMPHICAALGYDCRSADFYGKLCMCVRFMTAEGGPFLLHCKEGKDRTGIVVGLFASLMGASLSEIREDYLLTFRNYYGIGPRERICEELWEKNLRKILEYAFRTDDLEMVSLAACAREYFLEAGLEKAELDLLTGVLRGTEK